MSDSRVNPECKDCFNCENCTYIGEGDFMCQELLEWGDSSLVVEDGEPTDSFLLCKGTKWEGEATIPMEDDDYETLLH